jgi:Domain of unknown function (DUF6457)
MHEWMEQASGRLAGETGADAAEYALTEAEIQTLLDLARVAAHESGERTNAPLACYLVGLARGRSGGSLEALADVAAGEKL